MLTLQTPSTAPPNVEMEAKAYEGKERATSKKSKGNSGNGNVIGVRNGENGKAASSSGNDGGTQRSLVIELIWFYFLFYFISV